MPDVSCGNAMELLNLVSSSGIIFNDGHEVLARLEAGDELADIAEDLGTKFGRRGKAGDIRRVMENWPPLHLEAVSQMVRWALGKLDTQDRITLAWKGDAEHPETVTKFELRDHTLLVEFAHPPARIPAAPAGA